MYKSLRIIFIYLFMKKVESTNINNLMDKKMYQTNSNNNRKLHKWKDDTSDKPISGIFLTLV